MTCSGFHSLTLLTLLISAALAPPLYTCWGTPSGPSIPRSCVCDSVSFGSRKTSCSYICDASSMHPMQDSFQVPRCFTKRMCCWSFSSTEFVTDCFSTAESFELARAAADAERLPLADVTDLADFCGSSSGSASGCGGGGNSCRGDTFARSRRGDTTGNPCS